MSKIKAALEAVEWIQSHIAGADDETSVFGEYVEIIRDTLTELDQPAKEYISVGNIRTYGPVHVADQPAPLDVVHFTCHGYSAPAYSCDRPGDMSGAYVRADLASPAPLDVEVREAIDDLRVMCTYAEMENGLPATEGPRIAGILERHIEELNDSLDRLTCSLNAERERHEQTKAERGLLALHLLNLRSYTYTDEYCKQLEAWAGREK